MTTISTETTCPVSGFRQAIGLHVRELGKDLAIMELTIAPCHLNSQGSLHGGVVATMIDNAGGLAGCHGHSGEGKRKAVTLSLTTSYLASASAGTVTAIGRKRAGGRRIFTATVEVSAENGTLIAVGEATYRYLD